MNSSLDQFTYEHYKKRLYNIAEQIGFTILAYSPYPDYPDLQTFIIYNEGLKTSETACIHISGTHGIEGIAGAEIQIHLLETKSTLFKTSSNGFLMIFALNPFGFKFLRRTSLENIDLNRNTGDGLTPKQLEANHQWLRPLWRGQTFIEQLRGVSQALGLIMLTNSSQVMRTIAEGQNIESKGLFYTGIKKATEVNQLMTHLKPLLLNKKYFRMIDVHTGLGELYGEMLIHCAGDINYSKITFKKPIDIPGEKPNSYRGAGLLSDRFEIEFPKTQIHFTVQEFGVKSTLKSFFALSLENQYHWNHFTKVPKNIYLKHPIKKLFTQTFFSEDPEWLQWLKKEGTERFLQCFEE